MIWPSCSRTPTLNQSVTGFGVEHIADIPDSSPVDIPVVVLFIGFNPAAVQEVLDDDLFVEVRLPPQFFWIHNKCI